MDSTFQVSNRKIFRKLGYFTDQEGIMSRYISEAEQWKSHLENTKASILQEAADKDTQKAAILGSGWLLDVPFEKLAERFNELWLFDIKHPAQIRKKIKGFKNIRLMETDISGFATPIYEEARSMRKTKSEIDLTNLKPRLDFSLKDFDFVVSCNILNQLDIILIDYLRKCCKITTEFELRLRRLIQETHIGLLPKLKSCLISDVEELSVDKEGKIIHKKPLVYTDKLPQNLNNEWIWHFDNHSSYRLHCNTWFKVVAVNI